MPAAPQFNEAAPGGKARTLHKGDTDDPFGDIFDEAMPEPAARTQVPELDFSKGGSPSHGVNTYDLENSLSS